jgi:hypothetical protein
MPWWSKELWALRHRLREAYKVKTAIPSPENSASFKSIKTTYQRELRKSKSRSWKEFCSNNLNGNLFDELNKIAQPKVSHGLPQCLEVNGVTLNEPSSILNQFAMHFFPPDPPNSSKHTESLKHVNDVLNSQSPLDVPLVSYAELSTLHKELKKNQDPRPRWSVGRLAQYLLPPNSFPNTRLVQCLLTL